MEGRVAKDPVVIHVNCQRVYRAHIEVIVPVERRGEVASQRNSAIDTDARHIIWPQRGAIAVAERTVTQLLIECVWGRVPSREMRGTLMGEEI